MKLVGNTGIEPVVPEAADLQSAESPLILLPHLKLGCLGWVRTSDQMINSHLLYLLSYKAIKLGALYRIRTGVLTVKG